MAVVTGDHRVDLILKGVWTPVGSTADDHPVTELARLVQAVNDSGVSYERMAVRARARKMAITGSYLHQIARGRVKRPSADMIPAIAEALGHTEATVREAAARSAGVHVEHNVPYRTGQMLSRVEHMSPVNRDRWFRLAQAIADTLAAEEPYVPDSVVLTESGRAPDVVTEKATDRLTAEAVERAERTRRRRRQA